MKVLYISVSPTSTSLPNTVHVLVQAPPNFPYSYQNMKFYHPNVGPVPSWYEGNGIWFVKVPAGVPLQSLYTVVFDNPVLDGQTVGVSPYVQLGYDNGQNVFNLYTNFQFDNPEIDKWVMVSPGYMPRNPQSGNPTSLSVNINALNNSIVMTNKPNVPTAARVDGPTEYNQVVEISNSYLITPGSETSTSGGFNSGIVFLVGLWGTQLLWYNQVGYIMSYSTLFPAGGVELRQDWTYISFITDANLMSQVQGQILPQPSTPINAYIQMYFLQNSVSSYSTTSSSSIFTTGIYNLNNLTQNYTYQSSTPLPNSGSIFIYGFGRFSYTLWQSSDFINTYWIRVRGVLPNGQTPVGQIQLS